MTMTVSPIPLAAYNMPLTLLPQKAGYVVAPLESGQVCDYSRSDSLISTFNSIYQ